MNTKPKQNAAKFAESARTLGPRIHKLAGLQGLHDAIEGHVHIIASLRKANAKLRKELERVRDQCHEYWQNKEIIAAALHTEIEVSRVRQQNFETLADALAKGGR
jgi:hypothetical protein